MKNKIIAIAAAIMLFSLAIAVYAYRVNVTTSNAATVSCHCCGVSCPMKGAKADAASGRTTAGNSCACCGDSCPMNKGDHAAMMAQHPDSCPMMKDMSDADREAMKQKMAAGDGNHSCSCPCCSGGQANSEQPAV